MVRLLYGTDSAEVSRREEAGQLNAGSNEAVLRRLLERVGVSRLLAPGEDLMTADGQLKGVPRLSDDRDRDLLQLVPWLLRHKVAEDRAYETDSGRALQVTGAQGLEAGDAALVRHRCVSPAALNPASAGDIEGGALTRVCLLMTLMATYTAVPHFIPASAAFDAATGLPPEPETELRLPAETVRVFHDGIPLPAVTADDAALQAHASARFSAVSDGPVDPLFDREPLIVGGVLMGHPDDGTEGDHLLDEDLGWLMIARREDDGTHHFFQMPVTHLENTGPAARILRNYAALLALEGWDVPPPMPGRTRPGGKGKKNGAPSPAERRRRAQTPQARAGALLRVRSLTAPPHRPALPAQAADTASRAPAQYRDWRRAYFTRNTRRHLLDADGRPVLDEHGRPSGPVYGPDAVEDVTFTRRRTWVRGTWINEHLPPRPGAAPVYALDPRLTRTSPYPG